MIKVAIITRSTLYSVPGGDTIQAMQTAKYLISLGVGAEIKLSNENVAYQQYDLLHFFNIIRPADILYHSKKANKPFVVSTIFVDYSEYDKNHRRGIGKLFSYLNSDDIEYLKTVARWVLKGDHLSSYSYLWKGQRTCIKEILLNAKMILPNSALEYQRLLQAYACPVKHHIITNGIDPNLFICNNPSVKINNLVLCVARIEGIKNQLNLIKALNNTNFKLILIGSPSPNQIDYYKECRAEAAPNISFIDHLPQRELIAYYHKAKVHILPSWFETTGLSSLEAAAMGCNVVITEKGDAKEYFKDNAFYCDPAKPESILSAVKKACQADFNDSLRKTIVNNYTWKQAAQQTLQAYQTALAS